ncbi:hypothetical protein [Gaetbulibacter jejuensis]|uniref:Secreted protein n=1 Tax=Gaetbulibacter jejuensis TaxID=584607 RepID=A0ABN1JRK8_9FLAO
MKQLLICFAILITTLVSAQDETHQNLLVTDSTWAKEVFKFPIGFAQDISYSGFEEAQFPKGWGTKESPRFWSYAFVWHIEGEIDIDEHTLENDLQLYFDGLMDMKTNGNIENDILKTNVLLVKTKTSYKGKLKTFDRLKTKEIITLNVTVEEHYCKDKNTTLLLFRFSPKSFDDSIWNELNTIILKNNVCY